MELFNPLVHTLHLRSTVFRLESVDISKLELRRTIRRIFHAALKKICGQALRWKPYLVKSWDLSVLVIEEIAPLLQHNFIKSNRLFLLKQKLQQIIFRTSNIFVNMRSQSVRTSWFRSAVLLVVQAHFPAWILITQNGWRWKLSPRPCW